jgi:hypothetical protein
MILRCTKPGHSIFSAGVTAEMKALIAGVKNVSNSAGEDFHTLCAQNASQCVVDGEFALGWVKLMFVTQTLYSKICE